MKVFTVFKNSNTDWDLLPVLSKFSNSLEYKTASAFGHPFISHETMKLLQGLIYQINKTEQAVQSQGCANRAMLSNATVNNA